ncbi:LysR family transcriptional regulator [Simiduia agarivorans]|uniref:LysR family transcriptional regulator n=1 Tax=Simiduia agarivorans (strain DSM 21679 / JCM 13881 / BCRC 17597 / SA1) TaxID=1117647 RepID=K4KIA5_SIMAS|nr:LysR family transcriptional regulator [Simiduia agarivorans]AFU98884.1 LysR family transcriptional regulator [Simiduia agarivorans SA1 = DSM 21679]
MTTPPPFDLNLLRVFNAVYQTGSVTLAAEKCGLTQSSVSNALARLRTQVDGDLFRRQGRGIVATRLADQLYAHSQPALDSVAAVLGNLGEFDPGHSAREFYVCTFESVIHILQPVLDAQLTGSAARIVFRDMPTDPVAVASELEHGRLNLLLDVASAHGAHMRSEPLFSDRLVCVARRAHPRIQGSLTKAEFAEALHVLVNVRYPHATFADRFSADPLPARKVYCECSSEMSMLMVVARSDAIGLVPERLARQYQDALALAVYENPFVSLEATVRMHYARRLEENSAERWLREQIKKAARSVGPL